MHPLPPPLEGESTPDNVCLPLNSAGKYHPPDTGFATQFYPGTLDPNGPLVWTVNVTPGNNVQQPINFNVNPVSSPGVASVRTYSYTDSTYVFGAPILEGQKTTIAATGVGLLQPNNTLTPGLSVGMLGTAAQINNLRAYAPGNPYIAVDATPLSTAKPGPLHLLFSTPGNLYVLPSGFSVVQSPPPLISALAPAVDGNGNPAVAIAGRAIHAGHSSLV